MWESFNPILPLRVDKTSTSEIDLPLLNFYMTGSVLMQPIFNEVFVC